MGDKPKRQKLEKKKSDKPFGFVALVPLTELFSNSFMDDLEQIWRLKTIIPDPTTHPVLYRKPDVGNVD